MSSSVLKEEEIRKRDKFNKYLELVQRDAESIFHDRSSFIYTNCPACDSIYFISQFRKFGFEYVQCRSCDTLFVNPRPPFKLLKQFYVESESTEYWVNDFFKPVAEARRIKIFKPRAEYVASRFSELRHGVVGDIGAGFGLFLNELSMIWPNSKLFAIEPSKTMAEICRSKGLACIESSLEEVDGRHNQFDLLTAFELFEHLHNPKGFLTKVYELLKPGGYFLFTTLNGNGFDIQILWEKSKSISPPHHLNFINPKSAMIILNSVGFEVVNISTPGLLDWDIVESGFQNEGVDPGRLWRTVSKDASLQAKEDLQEWISKNNFSSHMRVVSKKP